MDLRDRGGGERFRLELGEDVFRRPAVSGRDDLPRLFRRERWHLVLQLRQFRTDVGCEQVLAGRQRLPELDEDRAEFLERLSDAHAAGRVVVAAAPGCG